jgi:hypothetical protein
VTRNADNSQLRITPQGFGCPDRSTVLFYLSVEGSVSSNVDRGMSWTRTGGLHWGEEITRADFSIIIASPGCSKSRRRDKRMDESHDTKNGFLNKNNKE